MDYGFKGGIKMWKENKKKIILSSIGILLPIFIGILLWDKLPETMISHWGIDGTPDGQMGKPLMITMPYLTLFLANLLMLGITSWDKSNKNQSKKAAAFLDTPRKGFYNQN